MNHKQEIKKKMNNPAASVCNKFNKDSKTVFVFFSSMKTLCNIQVLGERSYILGKAKNVRVVWLSNVIF